jgi:ATP-dependent Zn protease
MKRLSKKRVAAHHEAGHAVIARVLTLAPQRATIRPSKGLNGYCDIRDPYANCPQGWLERGHPDAEAHADIMATMAGAEAEKELLNSLSTSNDGMDRRIIAARAETLTDYDWPDWVKLESRLRKMTRMLVRRHWERIERLAQALLEKTTLNYIQIDMLIDLDPEDEARRRWARSQAQRRRDQWEYQDD